MDAMHPALASMSPDDTVAALGLLELLEECGQMEPDDAHEFPPRDAISAIGSAQVR